MIQDRITMNFRALLFVVLVSWSSSVTGFGGADDRYIKKYAMMKVYESCFGPDVVKEVRQEMKAACAKCAGVSATAPGQAVPPPPQSDMDKRKPPPVGAMPPTIRATESCSGFSVQATSARASRLLSSTRDLDIKGQLETLTSRLSGKIRNVTCVMQELGYLDENLEPNFERIAERINRLPIGEELKRDMVDGVQFCKQFAQCVPETRKDKFQLSRELVKPMFFFRCYKHKKLEACIMKDVRERYTPGDDMAGPDEDNIGSGELRSLSWSKNKPDYDDMATAVYEFLYGGENSDLENIGW
ncbi:hypothetical protein C0J52_15573 [Blattella germanica]|nr:hypothetical protein C0J52_15573 [Blattella germanica]